MKIKSNGWNGETGAHSDIEILSNMWIREDLEYIQPTYAAPEEINLANWRNDNIGWGVIIPDSCELNDKDKANGKDLPEIVKELISSRNNAPIFRYRKDLNDQYLRRYYNNGQGARDLNIVDSQRGIGDIKLPRYLLIIGSPQEIPWKLQYNLNMVSFVGRLDLNEEQLKNYITRLLSDWDNTKTVIDSPLVWSTNHSADDITNLLQASIANPVAHALNMDCQIKEKLTHIESNEATIQELINQLIIKKPSFILSTSHGFTGLNKKDLKQIGNPVDNEYNILDINKLIENWSPDGAIWYSHACCSAGIDSNSSYKGLFNKNDDINEMLENLASLGSCTTPLSKVLLGNELPLKAFIGHVEPTFDWTLQDETGQFLTDSLISTLYNSLHSTNPLPIGLAFSKVYKTSQQIFSILFSIIKNAIIETNESKREKLLCQAIRKKLTAIDRRNIVILGDPTVTLSDWEKGI